MLAWQVYRNGRPSEALRLARVPVPEPGPGEVRIRSSAMALNQNEIDACHGRYLTVDPPLPCVLGMEVTGVVVADVGMVAPGARAAIAAGVTSPAGAPRAPSDPRSRRA
jgi:NADPH:quinone reductase-like Zn-dependent oxidoreductase